MTKQIQWNNVKKWVFLVVLGWSFPAFALTDNQFYYFGSKIDYWAGKPPKGIAPSKPQAVSESKKEDAQSQPNTAFPWKTYLDPKNKEFFKEGDYVPPEPFIEIVRNPTDENLKNWFAYIEKKNDLSQKLQIRMKEYLEKNSIALGESGRASLSAKVASLPRTNNLAKRYRFRMYFDSHCPHCRKMFGTLQGLQSKGFFVEAKQVDSDTKGLEGLGISTSRAAPEEIQEKDIRSVPVLLIGDLETKTVYRLTGYQSEADIFAALRQPPIPEGGKPMN